MRSSGYHTNEKKIEKENESLVLEDLSSLNVKNRFLMLLVYYHLYITYALAGFLFDLDQSNICRYSKD